MADRTEDELDLTVYFERLRRHEIETWLVSHDVDRFVVLDDLAVFEQQHPWMVQTDPMRGLTEADAARATVILQLE